MRDWDSASTLPTTLKQGALLRYTTLVHDAGIVRVHDAVLTIGSGLRPSVIVRLEAIGVCQSDIKEIAGTRAIRRDFGHELVGRVVFSDVDSLPVGVRVGHDPHVSVERTCGFAEFVLFNADHLITSALPRIPESLVPDVAVFAEPLSCVVHFLEHLTKWPKWPPLSAAVIGAGTAGTLIATLLTELDCEVTLINRSADRLEKLANLGTFAPERLRELADPTLGMFELTVVATAFSSPELVAWAAEHTLPEGLLALYGATSPSLECRRFPVNLDQIRRQHLFKSVEVGSCRITITGSHGALPKDFRRAITMLSGRTSPSEQLRKLCMGLINHRWTLDEAALGMTEAARGRLFGKSIVNISPWPQPPVNEESR